MGTFAAIVRWEVRYYLRRISTWVYFGIFFAISMLFMLVITGAFGEATVLGAGGKVQANAPLMLARLLPMISLLGVSITAALAGNALHRDFDAGMDPLVYTTPLSRPAFLGGRFVGSLIVNAFVLLGIGLGAAVAFATPWAQPENLAPFNFTAYAQPYLTHIYPNLILTAAIFFSLVAITRQMLPNYIGGAVLLVGYLLSATFLADFQNRSLAALLDPFGMRAMAVATEYWTLTERNTALVPMTGLLLTNRLVWAAIAVAVFAIGYFRFSFSHAASESAAPAPPAPLPAAPIILAAPVRLSDLPAVRRDFGSAAAMTQFRSVGIRSLWRIVGNRYFGIIVAAGLLYLIVAARAAGQIYGTTTWPVTYQMVEVLSGTFGLFQLVIIAMYAGELVWSERDAKIAGIHDTTPLAAPVDYLARLTALLVVVALLQLVLMIAGIIMQASVGYYRFEIGQYLQSLLGIQLIDLWLLAVLAFATHVVVNNKYLGHFVVLLIAIGNGVQGFVGLEHKLLDFGGDGGATYSDMNGWGPFLGPLLWWKSYWVAFAILLMVIVHLLWVRGADTDPDLRLDIARRRLRGRVASIAGLAGAAFVGLGAFLYYNTSVLNVHRGRNEERDLRISYEKDYKRYAGIAQPRISRVTVAVDLHPDRGAFDARGRYLLHNRTAEPIDTVVLTVNEDLEIRAMRFDRPSSSLIADPARNFHVHRLAAPLAPGDSMSLEFDLGYHPRGFPATVRNTFVVSNGSFLSNALFLPGIGYEANIELSDDDARRKAGLPEKPRMRPPTDPSTLRSSYITDDADFVRYEATVSTTGGQTAIASGDVDSTWSANGRRYWRYSLDAPIVNLWAIQSADYTVRRDRWRDVDIEIDYHSAHDFNVDRMVEAVKQSLEYFTTAFGPYQHRIVRIVEFPRYATYAQSLPNTIPYSEAIGFIARLDDPGSVDYPFYVTAHEVAHQWWAHQVVGANAQGATMLSETLAQYSALMVMEKRFGHANMRRFLAYELNQYLTGRSNENKREMPLQLVENQQYIHYNKGSIAMYALRDYIGEERVNAALRGFLAANRFRGPPYPTSLELVDSLRAVTPDSLRYIIADLFETITLYELRTDSIVVSDSAAGLYRVDIYGLAKKLRADSMGVETEVAMDDWMDIVLYRNAPRGDTLADRNGVPIYQQKHRIRQGAQRITIAVRERPIRGGIDPMNKLVDRRADDNTKGVFDRTREARTGATRPASTKRGSDSAAKPKPDSVRSP